MLFRNVEFTIKNTWQRRAPAETGAPVWKRVHLQWFAAEDEGRTEEPTERKLRRAREEEGRVVKSKELVDALMLLLPALAILALSAYMLRTFAEMLRFFLTRAVELDPARDRLLFGLTLRYFARLVLPLALVALVAALAANIAQVGVVWTLKPLEFKPNRIIPNFATYFQKTLFSANGVFNLFKSVVKMAIIGGVAFFLIYGDIDKIAALQTSPLMTGVRVIGSLAIRMLIISALLLLLLSIPDYMFQRWQHREALKMKREEVKEEWKEEEGDPQVKQRIRQRMRELLQTKVREIVPRADVVITNPTHFAVALEYNRETMPAPRVLIKGEDGLALRIKQIARENNVPIEENKPLARALYDAVPEGALVPEEYFTVIIDILRRVYAMDAERARRAGF